MTTTTRLAGAALALTTALTGIAASPGSSWAATKHRPSYAKVFSGAEFVGKHHRWVLVDHRDPIHTKRFYDEDDVRWNCTIDGNGDCGTARPVRGFISRQQGLRFKQRFHRRDVCLRVPDDMWGAVWCTDGRTYAEVSKISVQV